jgi:hypothetical protein
MIIGPTSNIEHNKNDPWGLNHELAMNLGPNDEDLNKDKDLVPNT